MQICQRDKLYDSYVEMPISCQSNSANFSRIAAAALVTPGRDLLISNNAADDDLLLVAAFHSDSPGVTSGSAVCVYWMTHVRTRAADNVRKCHRNTSVLVGTHFFRQGAAEVQHCTYSPVSRTVETSNICRCDEKIMFLL